jgi:hypothetical protein
VRWLALAGESIHLMSASPTGILLTFWIAEIAVAAGSKRLTMSRCRSNLASRGDPCDRPLAADG